MKMSSLKISLRSSGDRSKLSHTISRIRRRRDFFLDDGDSELDSGE